MEIASPLVPTSRKIVFLTFPATIADQPHVCNLAKEFDLAFSIREARITPRKEGFMILEVSGEAAKVEQGLDYLRQRGVKITPAAQKITRDEESCTHCGLCTALCLTGALTLDPASRHLKFDPELCTACGLCTRICPVHAMGVDTDYGALEQDFQD